MIMKFETEKGFGYCSEMTNVIVSSFNYSKLMEFDAELDERAKVKPEVYYNAYLYWSIKKVTNVDYVDFWISQDQQCTRTTKDKDVRIHVVFYTNKDTESIKRALVFIGQGYLLNDNGQTIERIK